MMKGNLIIHTINMSEIILKVYIIFYIYFYNKKRLLYNIRALLKTAFIKADR